MFKRYGSVLLLLCAVALVCLPSLRLPAARVQQTSVPGIQDIGGLHYIMKGSSALLDLNSATPAELAELPKVGEKLAQRIWEHRQTHGPFENVREIMEVEGIGEGIFAAIEPYIAVTD